MAERIGREEFEEKVLKSGLPVLVDFYSDSCMACKKLAPGSQPGGRTSRGEHLLL